MNYSTPPQENHDLSTEQMLLNFCSVIDHPFDITNQRIIKTASPLKHRNTQTLTPIEILHDVLFNNSNIRTVDINVQSFLDITNQYTQDLKSIYKVLFNWIRRSILNLLKTNSNLSFNITVNFEGLKVSQASSHTEFMNILKDIELPSEKLHLCVLYNVPSSFRIIFSFFYQFMSDDTVSKLVITRKLILSSISQKSRSSSSQKESNDNNIIISDEEEDMNFSLICQNLEKLSS